jgi:ATP-dependent RNA helicase RhlE
VDSKRKTELLVHLVKDQQWFQVLVFTRTKHGANRLAEQLGKQEISALAIHGNKSQGARTRALAEFKSAKLQVLVATDLAARGLDIEQLPHVVNFDLPNVPEDYVHRIGRTGRAGASGEAVSLVSPEEMGYLRDIERLIRRSIPRTVVAGFEAGSRSAAKEAEDHRQPPRPGPAPRARAASPRAHAPAQRTAAAKRPASSRQRDAVDAPVRSTPAPAQRTAAAKRPASSRQREAVDPLVRSNLPAGWTMSQAARRGR